MYALDDVHGKYQNTRLLPSLEKQTGSGLHYISNPHNLYNVVRPRMSTAVSNTNRQIIM